ncbi:MAG: VCBS repeat-containing protein [Pyrinomonadaceae bacterium]|nr:VCBS repeat-containing protein [Pyrinomonadaceae bacterium]
MSRRLFIGLSAVVLMIAGLTAIGQNASAQKRKAESTDRLIAPLLVEDFNYTAGALLVDNGWSAHSGAGTNSIAVTSPGLTLTGYPGSGVGNAASLTTTGEDVNRAFAGVTSGSVYAGFLVNVTEASTDPLGGYFFHFGPDPVGTAFRGRVFINKDASNNVAFGVSKSLTTAGNITYTPFSYALNTTYLIVLKYTVVDGATNDTVDLIVSSTTPATEPAATVSASDVSQSDITPATVSLRQGSTATAPTVVVDGIRVGTSWADIVSSAAAPQQHISDYNGDGKTDFALVRNVGGGTGGQIRWFINQNGSTAVSAFDWGISTDALVPQDYDGDNKTDIAVWRAGVPGSAAFYILQSNGFTLRTELFGQAGDDPSVVDDYDGDGKADVAVYRDGASSGAQSTWFYRGTLNNPSGNTTYVNWGQNGDFPAPGDYDGDGKADFVNQRNNGGGNGIFWMLQTTAGVTSRVFGTPTDIIVPGDYDGDGKTDLAVARGSGGAIQWFWIPSSTGVAYQQRNFGLSATDFIAQGDYDGDGKTDVAVWRASAAAGASAFWYLGSASGNAVSASFGQSGDYPPANYNSH